MVCHCHPCSERICHIKDWIMMLWNNTDEKYFLMSDTWSFLYQLNNILQYWFLFCKFTGWKLSLIFTEEKSILQNVIIGEAQANFHFENVTQRKKLCWVKIIDREQHWRVRWLKESMYILVTNNFISKLSIEINTSWAPLISKRKEKMDTQQFHHLSADVMFKNKN